MSTHVGLTAPRTVMIPGDKFIKMLEDVKHSIISCDKALEKVQSCLKLL